MNLFFSATVLTKKQPLAILIIFGALLLLMKIISAPGRAQSSMPAQSGPESRNQRLLEYRISKDLPFKIEMKKAKEESFKDLKNDHWLREFELELTNTGDKPIYFFYLTITTDVRVNGVRRVVPLTYGRAELGDIVTKAGSDDVPIKPGETYVLKPDPGPIEAWEMNVRSQLHAQATRLQAVFQELSFGDGTGYFVSTPYPPPGPRS